jgi:ABC-2 type transport system ATP-binding protein
MELEVRGLTKQFGPVTAVREVSFTAPAGQVTGLLGPNG